jgi:hypothetical protein
MLFGNISDSRTHVTGPHLIAKKAVYKSINTKATAAMIIPFSLPKDLEIKPDRAPPIIQPIRALAMTNPFMISAVPCNSDPSVGKDLERKKIAQMVTKATIPELMIPPFLNPRSLIICPEITRKTR